MIKDPDQILFNELKNGSETAFKKVYQDNRQLFLNFAKKYRLVEDDVLDIYQDAYIALYENIRNKKLIALKSSLSTYLISVGKYMIMNKLRKNKQQTDNESILTMVHEVDSAVETFDLVMDELSPNQRIMQKYFDQLGEKCKAILTLFYYQKHSIAQIMKKGNYNSLNVVKSQKSRCLKTLRELCKNNAKL